MTFRSEPWRRAVAQLSCAWCMRSGPSQCAHANHRGKGMGLKVSDVWTFPLCQNCHQEFDQGKRLNKIEKRDFADQWILETVRRLAESGAIKVTT